MPTSLSDVKAVDIYTIPQHMGLSWGKHQSLSEAEKKDLRFLAYFKNGSIKAVLGFTACHKEKNFKLQFLTTQNVEAARALLDDFERIRACFYS